jgi:hypothetical protein
MPMLAMEGDALPVRCAGGPWRVGLARRESSLAARQSPHVPTPTTPAPLTCLTHTHRLHPSPPPTPQRVHARRHVPARHDVHREAHHRRGGAHLGQGRVHAVQHLRLRVPPRRDPPGGWPRRARRPRLAAPPCARPPARACGPAAAAASPGSPLPTRPLPAHPRPNPQALATPEELAGAPAAFGTVPIRGGGPALQGYQYRMQVSPHDCTGAWRGVGGLARRWGLGGKGPRAGHVLRPRACLAPQAPL